MKDPNVIVTPEATARGKRTPLENVRIPLCVVRTWCVLEADHDGPCEEVPRRELPRTDFGPSHKLAGGKR